MDRVDPLLHRLHPHHPPRWECSPEGRQSVGWFGISGCGANERRSELRSAVLGQDHTDVGDVHWKMDGG